VTITISIPASIRKSLAIRPGTKLHAIEYRGRIRLLPVCPMKSARGFLRGLDTDVPRDADRI
jgi:bifunctional DNA-binding transcriptional regulator/antitoxin component of YhaV-PrlF toxin-antitoxin module